MPTLGEKLRMAREERGMSVGDVSEQTRIASHHLNAIEQDDYSGLPGGIFNRGFVKSFAKCVGIDEQEALTDYLSLTAADEAAKGKDELYSPDVFSDKGDSGSRTASIVLTGLVVLILVSAAAGLVYYLVGEDGNGQQTQAPSIAGTDQKKVVEQTTPAATPDEGMTIEISARDRAIDFFYERDGGARTRHEIEPGEKFELRPDMTARLSFFKGVVPSVRLELNGKEIELPVVKGGNLVLFFNQESFDRTLESGRYETGDDIGGKPVETPRPANTGTIDSANRGGSNANASATPSSGPRPSPPSANRVESGANRTPAATPRPRPTAGSTP